jgi:hypothetical protein
MEMLQEQDDLTMLGQYALSIFWFYVPYTLALWPSHSATGFAQVELLFSTYKLIHLSSTPGFISLYTPPA